MPLGFGMGFGEFFACDFPGSIEGGVVLAERPNGARLETCIGDPSQESFPEAGATTVQRAARQPA